MGVLERRQRLAEHPGDAVHRQRALLLHQLGQAQPRHQLHRVPLQPGASGDVVDAHDVGVPQPGCKLRLPPEALYHCRIGGQRRVQHLDGDVALQAEVARPVDAPEPAGANLVE